MHGRSRYGVMPGFRVRRERFGCLIYNHAQGSLLALRSPLVAQLLTAAGTRTVTEMVALATGLSSPPRELVEQAVGALQGLAKRGIVREV